MSRVETIVIEGIAQPEQTKKYLMLPFEMPADVVRVNVSYEYSAAIGSDPQLTGGNTIDIGIFDPSGHLFMSLGFRGWSGSARKEFFIAEHDATPGYMPGPLQVGTWHVCLGTYKVAENGCDYRVTVQFTFSEAEEPDLFPQRLALSKQARTDVQHQSGWYKGELHCHSYHSDGDSDPLDVVRLAESLGLDFLAITDHNVLSQQVTLNTIKTHLMLIPGMEVTTYRGHWNIWGAGDWIDFRVLSESDMQQAVNAALEQGYLISCNHPKPYGPEWEYPAVEGFHCIEVWNGPWELFNEIALTYWEDKLKAGQRHVLVGGSDNHFLKREHNAKLGTPTTYIHCNGTPSPAALLQGLRAGHAFITEAPEGAQLYLKSGTAIMGDTVKRPDDNLLPLTIDVVNAPPESRLEVCGATGIVKELQPSNDFFQLSCKVNVQDTNYVRVQLASGDGDKRRIHALTNPIYIDSNY